MSQDQHPLDTFADCILDLSVGKTLSYKVPSILVDKLEKGVRVSVPLRGKKQKATILALHQKKPDYKVLEIEEILDHEPKIKNDSWALSQWIANYYVADLQKVFRLFAPPALRKDVKEKEKIFVELTLPKKRALEEIATLRIKHPMQALVLELMVKQKKGLFLTDLLDEMKISKSPIDTLTKKKILSQKMQVIDRSTFLSNQPFFPSKPKTLNAEQKIAYDTIYKTLEENKFQVHLLYGITGSGKTEIYMQLMQSALDQGKTVIFQVPEVALTSQFIEKFKARFEQKMAIIHHKLSVGEKLDTWKNIEEKKSPIIIGARSSIFAPCKDLGLIIIDEEHDSSYKQTEEAPTYSAKDVAIMKAKFNSCPIVLGSATPSFESYFNGLNKKYNLITLTKRAQGDIAPVKIIDMKRECQKQGRFTYFSEDLIEAIKQRHERAEQTLLFLNRRGYHTTILCKSCSWIHKCPHCDLSLTLHKKKELICCHLCGYTTAPPKTCPECKSKEQIAYKGFGTEQVERALNALFPNMRILRIDRDTTQRKHSHEDLLKQFRSGKADVLIGTQMITKGLHFPSCTLVGVISIDSQLQIPDFRASEYVFQLITQVAGRAGRSSLKGEVILQTFFPENSTLKLAAKQDYLSFYKEEMEMRKMFGYPPYTRMGKLVFTSKDPVAIIELANNLRKKLLSNLPGDYQISPLIPCGYAKVKDHFRFQFLIKGPKSTTISNNINNLMMSLRDSKVSILVDIDPLYTYF